MHRGNAVHLVLEPGYPIQHLGCRGSQLRALGRQGEATAAARAERHADAHLQIAERAAYRGQADSQFVRGRGEALRWRTMVAKMWSF